MNNFNVLSMCILVTKSKRKDLEECINEFNNISDIHIEYDYQKNMLSIKSITNELLIYTKTIENAINFLEGFKQALIDFSDTIINLKGVKKDVKTKN